jgi:hypothetical protein
MTLRLHDSGLPVEIRVYLNKIGPPARFSARGFIRIIKSEIAGFSAPSHLSVSSVLKPLTLILCRQYLNAVFTLHH